MDDTRSLAPGAQPAVGTGEHVNEVLDHLFALPHGEQVQVLRAVVPRILGRLEDAGRARCIRDLRSVPAAEAKVSRPHPRGEASSRDDVIASILRQPIATQTHILDVAAPRVVADLVGRDREFLLEAIDYELAGAEQGSARV